MTSATVKSCALRSSIVRLFRGDTHLDFKREILAINFGRMIGCRPPQSAHHADQGRRNEQRETLTFCETNKSAAAEAQTSDESNREAADEASGIQIPTTAHARPLPSSRHDALPWPNPKRAQPGARRKSRQSVRREDRLASAARCARAGYWWSSFTHRLRGTFQRTIRRIGSLTRLRHAFRRATMCESFDGVLTRRSNRARNTSALRLADDYAAFHHERHPTHRRDIARRIALDCDEVRQQARTNASAIN